MDPKLKRFVWAQIFVQAALPMCVAFSPLVNATDRISSPDYDDNRSPFSIDHEDGNENNNNGLQPLPYSSQLTQGARMLAGGNASDAGRSLAAGEASGALQGWLGQFGTARIQIDVDRHGGWGHSSGDLLVPLYDNQRSLMFIQGGIRKPSDRLTGNLGYGVRTFWQNGWMYGGNVFFDDDFTGKNRRVGIGGEAWTDYLRLSANTYVGTSQWHTSRDFDGSWQEKPASGYDIRTQGWLPAYPQLGAKLVWEQYYGDQVALFDKDHLQRDPHAVTAGVEYTPVPLVTFGVDQKQGRGEHDTQLMLGMHWSFGHDWRWQTDPANVQALRTLTGSRYELVDRNNEIVLQYRKNPEQGVAHMALTVVTDNSPADGVTRNVLQVLATTRDGQPVRSAPVNWTIPAGSGVALTGTSVTDDNGLASATLTSTQVLSVPVTAQSGSVSATQQSHFTEVAVSHIALSVAQNNAVADGNGANIVVATLTDVNGRPVAGQRVNWKAPANVTLKGGDAVSDAAGKVTLSLTTGVAGSVALTATSGNQSAQTTVIFTGNAESAKISGLTVTADGSPADGKTANVAQAIITDANGNPLAGQVVTFKTDKTTVALGQSAVTDGSGKTAVSYTDTVAESLTLSATLSNAANASVSSLFVSDTNSARLKDFSVTTGAKASGTDTNTATVTVTDANGNPLAGTAVTFSITGSAHLSAVTANTDSSGRAQVNLTDTLAETVQVTAKLATGSSMTKATDFVADLDSAVLSVSSATGARADGNAANTATITLKDNSGNPLPGQTINLAITGSAKLSISSGVTDNNGQVVVTMTDVTAETITLTASLSNGKQSTAQATFIGFSVSALAASATSLSADGIESSTLTATVTDASGVVVANTPVAFTVSGSAKLSAVTVTTNGAGTAQVTLTDTVAETATITAKAQGNANDPGKTASVTFNAPEFTNITVNGHTFAVTDGFPTTGFNQAKFALALNGTASNYTWATNQPAAVGVDNSGNVTMIGEPAGSVLVTATPKGGGTPATYNFNVKKWFESNDGTMMPWSAASTYCSSRSEGLTTLNNLTSGYPTGTGAVPATRGLGNLWSEWGDMAQYSGSGFSTNYYYWATDSEVIAGYTIYNTVDLSNGSANFAQNGGNNAKVVCMKEL
ncbi:Ig-like domain-containing protein [Rahnella laticis]|uniref:Ig-like domain-containing protein n=1 Tax=Rahnella laticis TaxID=2787622 RepID=UPI0018A2EEF2|nr:inverse autotransporter beta domain-containing protein [Rahnella laticis]MBF7997452.1 inverse autotransporter beta domain-containing protein [Rahnella laticis]